MGEEELALQCKQANNRARKQLYEQYGGLLMAICLRYTGDKEAAEDVLHDGFIRIFQSIGQFSYQGEGSLRAWLSRVMVNEALGYLRKKNLQIQQEVLMDDIPDTLEADDGDMNEIPRSVLMSFPTVIGRCSTCMFLRKRATRKLQLYWVLLNIHLLRSFTVRKLC